MTQQINLLRTVKFTYIFLLISVLLSCQKEPPELKIYPDVSIELCPFFYSFEREAAKRGVIVDLRNAAIKGRLTKINGSAVGICIKHDMKEILIDREFWERSSQLIKELIVFHELGHCYLHKSHNNQTATNGTCESIMRSGLGGCIDFYNENTRDDLLDEFFSN